MTGLSRFPMCAACFPVKLKLLLQDSDGVTLDVKGSDGEAGKPFAPTGWSPATGAPASPHVEIIPSKVKPRRSS